MLCLPLPLVLWPTIVIVASILGGIAYGFFAPLIATFEFIGRNTTEKMLHCFIVSLSFYYIYVHILKLLACIPCRQFPGNMKTWLNSGNLRSNFRIQLKFIYHSLHQCYTLFRQIILLKILHSRLTYIIYSNPQGLLRIIRRSLVLIKYLVFIMINKSW